MLSSRSAPRAVSGPRHGGWRLRPLRLPARRLPDILRPPAVRQRRDRGREMNASERRKTAAKPTLVLKRELNEEQRLALAELEKFGWELKFIRRPMFQQPVPVVFDSDRRHYAVLQPDGTLNEKPGFEIRK
jgi:hypothetical protein